jgi:hypothetical protein
MVDLADKVGPYKMVILFLLMLLYNFLAFSMRGGWPARLRDLNFAAWDQFYKAFYVRNLRIFIIS